MNINFVLGGVESWTADLFDRLKRAGLRAKIFEPLQRSAYKYVGGAFYGVDPADVAQIGPYDCFLDYVERTIEYICAHAPCLYIDNGNMHTLAAVYHAKTQLGLPIKILSVLHGNHAFFYNRVCAYQAGIDRIIGVSDVISARISELLPRRAGDVFTRLQLPEADEMALAGKRNDGRLHIAYAARLESGNKRSMWICDIARGLRKRGVAFHMHVAGDGECLPDLRKFRADEGFANEITLYGQINHCDMNKFFRDKHVFVNFSVNEGGPLALFEAMSCGLAPVVTDTGAAAKLIKDGENGFFADSPERFVEKLSLLAGDAKRLRHMQSAIIEALESEQAKQPRLLDDVYALIGRRAKRCAE